MTNDHSRDRMTWRHWFRSIVRQDIQILLLKIIRTLPTVCCITSKHTLASFSFRSENEARRNFSLRSISSHRRGEWLKECFSGSVLALREIVAQRAGRCALSYLLAFSHLKRKTNFTCWPRTWSGKELVNSMFVSASFRERVRRKNTAVYYHVVVEERATWTKKTTIIIYRNSAFRRDQGYSKIVTVVSHDSTFAGSEELGGSEDRHVQDPVPQ